MFYVCRPAIQTSGAVDAVKIRLLPGTIKSRQPNLKQSIGMVKNMTVALNCSLH